MGGLVGTGFEVEHSKENEPSEVHELSQLGMGWVVTEEILFEAQFEEEYKVSLMNVLLQMRLRDVPEEVPEEQEFGPVSICMYSMT